MSDRRQIASSIRLEPIVRPLLAEIYKLPKQRVFYFFLAKRVLQLPTLIARLPKLIA
jgi:hypothetical protein